MPHDLIRKQYRGHRIRIRPRDFYFSLTDADKITGKRVEHYLANDSTKSFVAALSSETGIPVSLLLQPTKTGPYEHRGTWAHRKVMLHFAFWANEHFALWVIDTIDNLLERMPADEAQSLMFGQLSDTPELFDPPSSVVDDNDADQVAPPPPVEDPIDVASTFPDSRWSPDVPNTMRAVIRELMAMLSRASTEAEALGWLTAVLRHTHLTGREYPVRVARSEMAGSPPLIPARHVFCQCERPLPDRNGRHHRPPWDVDCPIHQPPNDLLGWTESPS
jgi:hypothetical protein